MRSRPVQFEPAHGGYTDAQKGRVTFDDGRPAFLKAATSDDTACWLRTEFAVYSHISKHGIVDFLPEVLAWDDDGSRPILVLEDLSSAQWPPPWEASHVQRVVDVLSRVRTTPTMVDMLKLEGYREYLCGWPRVAANPQPFLSLGLCTSAWLEAALPVLIAAELAVPLVGEDFLHLDVRSDNLCFLEGRTVLIDWNWSCAGNGTVDVAFWLPSLHAEGGPAPETILPDRPDMACAVSGFWASKTDLSKHDVRRRQAEISVLKTAFAWAVRSLCLPQPVPPLNQ